jgi:hypothetical protein
VNTSGFLCTTPWLESRRKEKRFVESRALSLSLVKRARRSQTRQQTAENKTHSGARLGCRVTALHNLLHLCKVNKMSCRETVPH